MALVCLYRLAIFIYDNLGDCIKESHKKSFVLFAPCLAVLAEGYLLSYTDLYLNGRGILFMLLNFSLAHITFHLMLTNMAKKPFKLLQVAYVYPLVPLVSEWLGFGSLMMGGLATVAALAHFYLDIYILSTQFMAYTGRTFFIRA